MKKTIIKEGMVYRLRPINYEDAEFILDVRLEDAQRNKYIHPVKNDTGLQIEWLKNYFERENDYYFVVENRFNDKKEGLISIYNIENNKAEWGRWIIKKGSLAAIESVNLMFLTAFEDLELNEVYARTIKDNIQTVKFHEQNKEKTRGILKNFFELNGIYYDAVEHYAEKEYYYNCIKTALDEKCNKLFFRELDIHTGGLKFHHIGVASNNIEKELEAFKLLGYNKVSNIFQDENQGIKGLFISSNNMPLLELLENLKESTTLNYFLDRKIKLYHFAYKTINIEKAKDILIKLGAKILSPMKKSTYFKDNICFLILNNLFIIELIEEKNINSL